MKTLADFKRKLKVGVELHTIFHQGFEGRNEKGDIIYKDIDKGVRKITIVQTNAFALETEYKGDIIDGWCDYPKAKDCIIKDNSITILEDTTGIKKPILTYTFI